MKPLGNTLYITKQGTYVSRDGTNVVISLEGKELMRLPIHTIRGLVCFGNVLVTPFALGLCGENNTAVSFLTENGRFLARVSGPQSGNVLLRRAQHRFTTNTETVEAAARCFVGAKVANARTIVMRFLRDHPPQTSAEQTAMEHAADYLANALKTLKRPNSIETLRGIEGDAAQTYFSVFNQFILTNKNDFYFHGRSRRPPLDNVNALLSFFYTILAHDCTAACESVGLDPQMGFLHADRPGRPSLALDLMEEFRPWFVDRFVLTLINLGQAKGKDFVHRESGGIEMQDELKREALKQWQERKKEEITHPFLGEKVQYGLLPFVQAQLLARYLRGDLDAYPPFFYR